MLKLPRESNSVGLYITGAPKAVPIPSTPPVFSYDWLTENGFYFLKEDDTTKIRMEN